MTNLTTLSGTAMSGLCFGTMQFGERADATASRQMFEACRSHDLNFFDTAHVYTGGQSETLLGAFAASERENLIIATKAGYQGGGSKTNILKTFDESRTRLGMEVIDLLYMHRFDDHTALEETFETLASLKEAGAIRYIGVSNYTAWQVMKAVRVAVKFDTKIDVVQPMYNLVKRQAEVEILPACADQGLHVCPYSPLGGGLLTGKYATDKNTGRLAEDERYGARYRLDWMHETAAALPALATQHGTHPATLAVAWVARHSAVSAPIISAKSAAQLGPSLDALSFAMDDAVYAEMAALSQTPPPATDRLEEM